MNNNRMRVVFVSLIMIFSSLAGCITEEDLETIEEEIGNIEDLGTVSYTHLTLPTKA